MCHINFELIKNIRKKNRVAEREEWAKFPEKFDQIEKLVVEEEFDELPELESFESS